MKRKPLEKLSDRLEKVFSSCVKSYTRSYYEKLLMTIPDDELDENDDYHTAEIIAKKAVETMTGIVMGMIDEYEPEDIE